jgi:osmoprotectant transport system ATP-binding protein
VKLLYEKVSKLYPKSVAPAVDEVSLGVPEGRLVVFLGPSGCGKTTLLKMTNRLIEPTSGTIKLDGEDFRQIEVTGLRRRIGYVIQQVGLFPHMSVAENVAVVPSLLSWPASKIAARVDELLELVDLPAGTYRRRYPSQLSGGQQQRVGLARALAGDPELILMDEPFGAIDAITRLMLQDEVLRLQRKLKKTILFVTHDVDEALRLADEIAVLRAGKLVQYGAPCELLARPADAFVSELLGADDRVRQLGMVRIETVMKPVGDGWQKDGRADGVGVEARSITPEASLRDALNLLLEPGVVRVMVKKDDQMVGEITLEHLKGGGCAD